MGLYTILFEYRGGTYAEQVEAPNETEALILWGQKIDPQNIQYFGTTMKEKLITEIHNSLKISPPSLLTGCTNIWCAGMLISGLVNIIKTAKT